MKKIEKSGSETLEERIGHIVDELRLAVEWQRTCILLIVYRSETVRELIQERLEGQFSGSGHAVVSLKISNKKTDIPLLLARDPGRNRSIFFIRGLRWGGGRGGKKAYQALNFHREHLVENRIRALFWLTPSEAAALPRLAPDFWAFRHRVIEFFDTPPVELVRMTAEDILPGKWQAITTCRDVEQEIVWCENKLADLADEAGGEDLQLELLFLLGGLLWSRGKHSKALHPLNTGLKIARQCRNELKRFDFLCGLGIAHQSKSSHAIALSKYLEALRVVPGDPLALSNLASTYQSLGFSREALEAASEAVTLNPRSSQARLIQGNIFTNLGFLEDAAAAYKRVPALEPEYPRACQHLAEIYQRMENRALASHFRHKAIRMEEKRKLEMPGKS